MSTLPFPEVRLGDLLASVPLTGVRQDNEAEAGGMPYVTTSMVTADTISISSLPDERTGRDARGRTASFGDILLVCRGIERRRTVPGVIVRIDEELAFSESLMRIRVNPDQADPEYIRLFLTSELGATALVAAVTGTTISYLRPDGLMSVRLALPPLDEQHLIAAKLGALQGQLAKLEGTVTTFKDLVSTAREGMIAGSLRARSPRSGGRLNGGSPARKGSKKTANRPQEGG
jgi:Restriction endonuclease S subunits